MRAAGLHPAESDALSEPRFDVQFAQLFDANYERLYRYLNRISDDVELAADLAQETFVRLYRRGTLPDRPEPWLITVALNLFRNARASSKRRTRLLSDARGRGLHADEPASDEDVLASAQLRTRVRNALDQLSERDRDLLLLRAEGFSYRDIAAALALNEASIGTLLARAKATFRQYYEGA
jgi:RNA polymerase sigma factor (sigma-70 family)